MRRDDNARGNENLRFAAAVAEYGMLLRNSEYKAQSNWENVIAMARQNIGTDPGGYRAEFVRLAEVAAWRGSDEWAENDEGRRTRGAGGQASAFTSSRPHALTSYSCRIASIGDNRDALTAG